MTNTPPHSALIAGFKDDCERLLAEAGWPLADRESALEFVGTWSEQENLFAEWGALAPVLIAAFAKTADPASTLRHFDRYLRAITNHVGLFQTLQSDRDFLRLIAILFSSSPYFADTSVRNPEYLEWCLRESRPEFEKSLDDYRAALQSEVQAHQSTDARRRALCRFKRREYLRIGVRDALGYQDMAAQCRELSALAQVSCELALEDCLAASVARFGGWEDLAEGETATPANCKFCIVAMGKFGGWELNFSSDIDLIFVFKQDGQSKGRMQGDETLSGRLTHREYYGRIAAAICRYLDDATEEGLLFRVDARLRPHGDSGALALPLADYVAYFADEARPWEKVAYIKARSVAGDESIAKTFDEIRSAFCFSANLPEEILPEIADLKRRIDTESLTEVERARDIKRGPGGIREIEFIAAAGQLLHGVVDKRMRTRSTIEALRTMAALGKMDAILADKLETTYWFHRRVEHLLQMRNDQQTQSLPDTEIEWDILAARCGFPGVEALRLKLDGHRLFVRGEFEKLFHDEEEDARGLVSRLEDGEAGDPMMASSLQRFGFATAEGFRALRALAMGPGGHGLPSHARRRFEELLPNLLRELSQAAQPDVAARQMAALVHRNVAQAGLFDLALSHPPVLKLLARLLGYGTLPARLLLSHPEWLDDMLSGDGLSPSRDIEQLFQLEVWSKIHQSEPQDAIVTLRRYKEREALLVSVQEILGIISPPAAAACTTVLADQCLRGAMLIAARSLPGPAPLVAVMALGSYGAREVHVCGDLDVAFFYDTNSASAEVAGKYCGHILDLMSAVSPEGQLWKVDARLRPDGKSAPLAVSIERVKSYYEREAGVWEFQSAMRARHAAGDPDLSAAALSAMHDALRHRSPLPNLAREIATMRKRLDDSVKLPRSASHDLKRGPGGIVDVEFIAQYFQLKVGLEQQMLLKSESIAVLDAARALELLDYDDWSMMREHYMTLRTIQRATRLLTESTKDHLPAGGEKLDQLCRALSGLVERPEETLESLPGQMKEMRALFNRIVSAEATT